MTFYSFDTLKGFHEAFTAAKEKLSVTRKNLRDIKEDVLDRRIRTLRSLTQNGKREQNLV